VLDIYALPPDPAIPLVCFDESGKELRAARRGPLPLRPGTPVYEDPEYTRHGSANLFMLFAPPDGWRQVLVTAQRTRHEFAQAMRSLVDDYFPQAERIRVVLDNLNTHRLASLYHAFAAAEAHRIAAKLEFHFTPKHGSWLNMAELELSVLSRQCLARRIPDRATLEAELAAWVTERNDAKLGARWTFTRAEAHTELAHVYPQPTMPQAA
jgi:transposase